MKSLKQYLKESKDKLNLHHNKYGVVYENKEHSIKTFKETIKESILKEDDVSGVYTDRDELLQKLWKLGYTMENRKGRELPDKEYVWKNDMIFKVPFIKKSDGSYIVKNKETLGKGTLPDFNNFLDGRYTPVKI